MLYLDAPGMKRLQIPTSPDAYKDFPTVRVESAGVAAGIEWSLAFLDCKQHPEGSVWITNYLNSTPKLDIDGGRLVNGRKTKGSFALVRSLHDVVDMGAYPPLFPLIERSKKTDADYKKRFEGNFRRLSDFSPFLLVSKASARLLSKSCDVDSYPTLSFRGNIIVDGEGLEPWAEESWAELEILSSSKAGDQNEPGMLLHTIKACPRCTVPCRNQITGKYLFKDEKLKLWKVLKALYPGKFNDPEWGSWAGAYMGVYMGHHGKTGKLVVGDKITPTKIRPWDAHLQNGMTIKNHFIVLGLVCAVISIVAAVLMKA
jgi:hypothetical protein